MLLLMFSLDKQQCLPVRAVAWSGWHGFCSQAMIRLKFLHLLLSRCDVFQVIVMYLQVLEAEKNQRLVQCAW